MRALANFIMRGRLPAMLVAATSSVLSLLLPPVTAVLAYVGAGALMLVTLRRGVAEGALVLVGALLATGLFGYLSLGQAQPVVIATLILWLPAWLVAGVLRISRSLPWAVLAATGFGLVAVLLVYAWVDDPAASWRGLLEPLAQEALRHQELGMQPDQVQQLLQQASSMMTGTVAAALVLGLLLSLMLARGWQALLYNPGGFRTEFQQLALPGWFSAITLAGLLLARFTSGTMAAVVLQMGLVVLVPLLFVGTAVVHGIAVKRRLRPWWLISFYVLLFVLPEVVVLVVVIGVLDGWFRFRDRVPEIAKS